MSYDCTAHFNGSVMESAYEALLLVSFGGPEDMEHVMPFLENVTRGRNVPRERLQSVAKHYELFGGISPINEQNRLLIASISRELERRNISLPIYWGNRNWHPYLTDTVREMTRDGIRKAIAFVTSAYGSYSSCRMYLNDIDRARDEVGEQAPIVHKLPLFYNNEQFIVANADHLVTALNKVPAEYRQSTAIVFSAHSIPLTMADNCAYSAQLDETARLVCARSGLSKYHLVYQSRSGPPSQPWLEPDVCDYIRAAADNGTTHVVILPIGFICDHMEVMYDIEIEARQVAQECGVVLERAACAGTHPAFISMIADMIAGSLQSPHNNEFQSCRSDCCPAR